jgi:hypothetical protein
MEAVTFRFRRMELFRAQDVFGLFLFFLTLSSVSAFSLGPTDSLVLAIAKKDQAGAEVAIAAGADVSGSAISRRTPTKYLVAAAFSRHISYRVQIIAYAFFAVLVDGFRSPGSRALPHIDWTAWAFWNQSIGQAAKERALSGIDNNAAGIWPLALQG